MLRRLAELDRLDARHGLGADPRVLATRPRSRTRHRFNGLVTTVATVGIIGLFLAVDGGSVAVTTRSLLDLGPEPPVRVALRDPGNGSYAFMATQPGSDKPVTYDPCRAIRIEVNPDGAPPGYRDLVDTAARHVAEPTGLRLAVVGETGRRPHHDDGRTALAGGSWPPVLVSWADDDEVPGLAGEVAGLGGSTSVEELGHRRYVTGEVTLDAGAFRRLSGRPDGRAQMQAILDHEFGHLVGLTHVRDRGELMSDDNVGRTTWGPGDLAGLSRLGRGRCG
jgi:hypothetical protein